jgi:hypothetical protein
VIIMTLWIALLTVLLSALPAYAQRTPLLARQASPVSGVTVIPPSSHKIVDGRVVPQYMSVDQHVIPRYANVEGRLAGQSGKSVGPAGQLIGWGPMSVLRGTAQTKNQPTKAIIVTEDIGKQLAQWSSGEYKQPGYRPAVLRPVLRDFTLVGHDETGTNYQSGGVVNNEPGRHNPAEKFPDLYGGVFLQASGAQVENVTIFYIPGTAFHVARTGAVNTGALGPWDVEKTMIRNCAVHRAYRGFNIQVVDAVVGRLQGYALRDYGIKFTAGATQIDGAIHFWGVSPGPCVWFPESAGGCWGGPLYVENSPVGMLMESAGNTLGPIYSKQCQQANIKITRERNVLGPIDIEVAAGATGVSIYGQFNKLLGGSVTLASPTSVGVSVVAGGNSGNGLVIRDVRFLGSSPTAGTAFTTADVLNNTTIEAHFQNVGTGMDLYPQNVSKIGMANDIDITTSAVGTPISLPPTWHPSNRIRINGVLQRPGR